MKSLTVASILLIGLAAFAQVINSGKHNNFDAQLHCISNCHLYISPFDWNLCQHWVLHCMLSS